MELDDLQPYLNEEKWKDLQAKISAEVPTSKFTTIDTYLKQYDPAGHDIADQTKRPDKIVYVDSEGEDGKPTTSAKVVPISRLSLPFQKEIVKLAAAFLCGNPIELMATTENELDKAMLQVIKHTWDTNKLNYDSKAIAKKLFSETEVAEIWYVDRPDETYWKNTPSEGAGFRLRFKIVAPSLGDKLYPVFNQFGDMIAFGRYYQIKIADKTETHFDLYTDKTTYTSREVEGKWVVTEKGNVIGKIPVIYYQQDRPDWADVQSVIDRFELSLSNHADNNDYFSSPSYAVTGEVKVFASKGEQGKVFQLQEGGDIKVVSWDQSPKSLELEFQNLRSLIYDLSSTPDISIEQMKSLGTYSGIALKMLFLGAHLKAADKEENFGKSIQRRINFIKAAMVKINVKLEPASALNVTPKFEYYLPKDIEGMIDLLTTATGNKPILTQESAVKLNPLVRDPDTEAAKLKEESTVQQLENTPVV